MPPRGGGRKAFLKGVHKQEDEDSELTASPAHAGRVSSPKSGAHKTTAKHSADHGTTHSPVHIESKPSTRHHKDEEEDSGDERDNDTGVETRGQMLQRHKKEAKALKDAMKKMGKKKKEELAKMEQDLKDRHEAELKQIDEQHAVADTKHSTAQHDVHDMQDEMHDMKIGDGGKKPTKAQKRREKLAQKEAERESAIEAEKAAMGETDRDAEQASLRAILQPLNLAIKDIQPDGHCMYRAVEHQLATQRGTAKTYQELRQLTAQYLREHADEFAPFVIDEDSTTDFEHYCHEVESTAAWGGDVELNALSHALRTRIKVYSAGMPAVEFGPAAAAKPSKDDASPLQLCFLRHEFGLGEHYNSVVAAGQLAAAE